jgi:hypothetical protein
MGCGPSVAQKAQLEAQKAHTETQLREFALRYNNADMPSLLVDFGEWRYNNFLSATANTSDMPAASKAIGDMFASLQRPLEPVDTAQQAKRKTIGPFTKQIFQGGGKEDPWANEIYKVALVDALDPLGWKLVSEARSDRIVQIWFVKQEDE